MSKIRPAQYISHNTKKTRHDKWPSVSPYEPDYQPKLGGQPTGRKVKVCPVNSSNQTIFKEEWYHGDI